MTQTCDCKSEPSSTCSYSVQNNSARIAACLRQNVPLLSHHGSINLAMEVSEKHSRLLLFALINAYYQCTSWLVTFNNFHYIFCTILNSNLTIPPLLSVCSIILAHAACQVGCLGLQHLKFEEQGQQSWRTQRLRIQNFQKSLMRFQIPDAENATHHKKRCRRCCKRKRKTTLYNNNSQPCKQHKIDGGVNHDDNDYTTSSNFGWWIH